MTKKHIKSFFLGLLISGVFCGIVYFILLITSIDLFGIQKIRNPEAKHAKFFYTGFVLCIIISFIVIRLLKDKWYYSALGVALPGLIGLFLMLNFGVVYLNKSNYYEKFDKVRWKASGLKPIKMARELSKSNNLIGIPKEEITKMLGEGRSQLWDSTEYVSFATEVPYCEFVLGFKNSKVETVSLWVDD